MARQDKASQPPGPESADPAQPVEPSGPAPDQPAARRKRIDRVTLVVIGAMLAVWAGALYFRSELKAYYCAWRLSRAGDDDSRDAWVERLSQLGPVARSPALKLTRHDAPQVRLAGVRVLLNLIKQDFEEFVQKRKTRIEQGRPEEAAKLRFLVAEPVRTRMVELLSDRSADVQLECIEAVVLVGMLAGEPEGLTPLTELAISAESVDVATRAAAAISEIEISERTGELLRRIVRQADRPEVRAEAIDSLRPVLFHGPETLAALVDALDDDRPVARATRADRLTAELLSMSRPPRRVETLPDIASQPEPPAFQRPLTVAGYADRALRHLTRQDVGFEPAAPPAERQAAVARWRDLVRRAATQPATAPN